MKHRVSEIFSHAFGDDTRQQCESPETPIDEEVTMTRSKLNSIVSNALTKQLIKCNENSTEVAKLAYVEGYKDCSERQPIQSHSSSMETESVHFKQKPVIMYDERELQYVHQLRPDQMAATYATLLNHVALGQVASNVPTSSIYSGVIGGNQPILPMSSLGTGLRYKSQFNITQEMLN